LKFGTNPLAHFCAYAQMFALLTGIFTKVSCVTCLPVVVHP